MLRKKFNYQIFVIIVLNLVFHLYIFFVRINDKYHIFDKPLSDLRVKELFQDDRTYWLEAILYFGKNFNFGEHNWQLNLWAPGHLLFSSLTYLIFGKLILVIVFNYFITFLLMTLILFQVHYWLRRGDIKFSISLVPLVLFLFSPIYTSALVDTFFVPDLQATLAGSLAILRLVRLINLENQNSKLELFYIAVLLAFAGYLRLTYYQLTIYVLFISTLYLLFVSLREQNKKRYISYEKVFLSFKILVIAFLIFLPWILIRGYVMYPGNFAKGLEFSLQGRFALQTQWYDDEKLKTEPVFPLIGQGIACKVDKVKCAFFTNQNREIANGNLKLTMDEDFDLKAKAAIETFVRSPIEWIGYKLPIYGPTFFQASVYDKIDKNLHVSWDRILILICFIINPFLWIYAKLKRLKLTIGALPLILLSCFQLVQFLLTQLLFRFYLPAIAFTLMASLILIIGLREAHLKSSYRTAK